MSHQESTATRGGSTRELPLPGPVAAPGGIKGGFRFSVADGIWWWSPGMYMLLGLGRQQIAGNPPSTRLLLRHLHPADHRSVAQAWQHLRQGGGPVAFGYRIVGADGVVRPVYVTASTERDSRPGATVVSGVIALEGIALDAAALPTQQSRQ